MNTRLLRRALASLIAMAILAALALRPKHELPAEARRQFLAMGTQISITLALPAAADRARATQTLDAVQQQLEAFGRDAGPWADGQLGALNRQLAAGQRIRIPDALLPLWQRALALRSTTDGAFEPRIGALVRLWGFDDVARLPTHPPAQADIRAALTAMRAAPAALEACGDAQCYGPAPGVQWDFGAIAKGWIVDRALQQLQHAGYADALVDAGGNLAVHGQHGKRPWRIAIRNPRGDGSAARPRFLATVDAHDEAVNTHGDYERYFEFDGRRYCHILNPARGWPAQGLESVTVLYPDAAYADAAGAAVFVAGSQHWRETARRLGLDQVLVVDRLQQVYATPALIPRLRLEPGIVLTSAP